ncbi:MAG: TIGR03621 family F420-dependent LLM class oxidoreductase [Acidimicrobiales bacterium]
MRPFRFSVSLGRCRTPDELVDRARRAEALGFSAVSLPDHLDEQCGPIAGLTAVALATTEVRLTTLVLANDYRHPAVLAKELATLDLISKGRLEIGIGAGWMTADYERGGLALDRPGVRIARLAEAIEVLKGCFGDGAARFEGEHYTIAGLDSRPKPAQRPHPRLLVAGGGAKVLALAARSADIVGVNPGLGVGVIDARVGPTATAAATDDKIAVIKDAAGARFDSLELQTRVHIATIDPDREALAAALAPALGLDGADALASPHALVGTVAQCVDTIGRWRDRWGISYITIGGDAMETMAPVVQRLSGT